MVRRADSRYQCKSEAIHTAWQAKIREDSERAYKAAATQRENQRKRKLEAGLEEQNEADDEEQERGWDGCGDPF